MMPTPEILRRTADHLIQVRVGERTSLWSRTNRLTEKDQTCALCGRFVEGRTERMYMPMTGGTDVNRMRLCLDCAE